ncbi:DGQHR domain-containing protein [Paeniclostridium sordellii]|nr:DGQHR domain-containing protein [Paeniclostridium sordellii]MSB59643.1 DGQHR domain-containing protein [Paeniclostridium sordellii]
MNNIKRKNIEILQDRIKIVITSLTVEELIKIAKPEVYNSIDSPQGYQRPINNNHVKNIIDYLKNEQYPILPTSMVMAIDTEDFVYRNDNEFNFNGYLRIVDGQHRIEAMRRIVKELKDEINLYPNDKDAETQEELEMFLKWEYPVNIMLLDKKNNWERYIEIRSFVDINKKGKTVATDLADTNMRKIRTTLEELPQKQAIHQVSLEVVNKLIEDKKSVWYKSIKTGDTGTNTKIIGIGQFSKSIMPLSRKYLYFTYSKKEYYFKNEIEDVVSTIYTILKKYWIYICYNWKEAFTYNQDMDTYSVNYDYSIQKGIGVFPLHRLLTTEFMNTKDIEQALESCRFILYENKSKIVSEDWEVGGTFTSYSSSSGYAKINKMLRGELDRPKEM